MLKRTLVIIFGLFLSVAIFTVAEAQDNHFVYIQTNNGQPFYLKMNDQLYSSTASGYLILSRLQPGEYRFVVGFPRNEFPEESFQFAVNDTDEGYLMMPSGSGTLILNMKTEQPMAKADESEPEPVGVQQHEVADKGNKETKPEKKKNAFSDLLGQVVNDSSVDEDKKATQTAQTGDAARPMAPGTELVGSPGKGELITANTGTDSQSDAVQMEPEATSATAQQTASKANKSIVLILSGISEEGEDLVYLDDETKDTIRVLVPYPQQNVSQSVGAAKEIQKPAQQDVGIIPSGNPVSPENTSEKGNIDLPVAEKVTGAVKTIQSETEPEIIEKTLEQTENEVVSADEKPVIDRKVITEIPEANEEKREPQSQPQAGKTSEAKEKSRVEDDESDSKSACSTPADRDDFLKLRKAIAGEADWDVMVEIVTKAYNEKCFTTEQTKNLTYLFLTDEGRYRFLDATYDLVSDPQNFSSLAGTMDDPYYVRRFKAMLR